MNLTSAPAAVVRRWAVASHEGALANARVAAVECSRRLLERAEVETYLLAAYPVETARPGQVGVAAR